MTNEPKLLSEHEAQALWAGTFSTHAKPFAEYLAELRERGLIAPEPVDPWLEEAEAVHGEWVGGAYGKDADTIDLALAALRRGMELAQPPLTREQLGDAIVNLFGEGEHGFRGVTPRNIDRLHAALTQGTQP